MMQSALADAYAGLFSKGFSHEELENKTSQEVVRKLEPVLRPCIHDSKKLQFPFVARSQLQNWSDKSKTGLSTSVADDIWKFFRETCLDGPAMRNLIIPSLPEVDEIFEIWDSTTLTKLSLTSIGFAIAHSNLTRIPGFDAPLEIWVK